MHIVKGSILNLTLVNVTTVMVSSLAVGLSRLLPIIRACRMVITLPGLSLIASVDTASSEVKAEKPAM